MSASLSVAEEEARKERAVLREVLELYPAILTKDELLRVLGADMSSLVGSVEPWVRAIAGVCRHGLLRVDGGENVFLTAAALRAWELLGEWNEETERPPSQAPLSDREKG